MQNELPLYKRRQGRTFQISTHSALQGDNVLLAPGEKHIILDMEGPGIIENFWCTLDCKDPHYLRKVTLRFYWDQETEPSVEAPLGDFFGTGFGLRTNYISQYLGVTSGGFYCYFPMPFRSHARMEIINETAEPCTVFHHVLGQKVPALDEDVLYFHACWRRENPTQMHVPYTVLEAEGKGYFAGMHLYMQAYDEGDKMNFLEGDEFIYIDGETEASIKGTGTEDYFQGGWYFIDGPFHAPYHGMTHMDWGKSRVSCYRFHILDRIHFDTAITVQMEHGQRIYNEARVDYSSVAYWYQTEPHKPYPYLPAPSHRERVEPQPLFRIPGAIEFEYVEPAGSPYFMSTYQRGWSNNMARHYAFRQPGDGVEHVFDVAETRTYAISANYIQNDANGILQLYVDGRKVGEPVDTYAYDPKDDYLLCRNQAKGEIYLGCLALTEGKHTLRIEAVGRNADSKGYEAIVDCIAVNPCG